MAEIVNLRRARKARALADKEALAAENRVKHGRSKPERERLEAEAKLKAERLENHRLKPAGDA